MATLERTPREKETLMFPDVESARVFRERVQTEMKATPVGISRDREILAKAVAQEFEVVGEAVDIIREPWNHSRQEHREVQQLVDMSFATDLRSALAQAKKSPTYPRNLDLFHDVLTSELYDYVKQAGLNKPPLVIWAIEVGVILLTAAVALLLLLLFVR